MNDPNIKQYVVKKRQANKRLKLRAIEPEDVDLLYEVENDMSHWAVTDTTAPFSRDLLMQYANTYDADPFRSGQLRLVIEKVDKKIPVGILDFYEISCLHSHAKVGIYILAPWRGYGFAYEAIQMGAEFSMRELNLKHLLAIIDSSHAESLHLFRKCGFIDAGILRKWHRGRDVSLLQISF